MGYELSKPMLRAELEADLKRCALTVSIVSCIATMYTIHEQSKNHISLIKQAYAHPCTAYLP